MHVKYTFKKATFSLFLLILVGCGSTEVHQIFLRQPSLIENREIEVYVAGAPPKRAYYDIAIVQAIGHGSDADVEHVTHALATRAARLGCDAVVRVHVELGYGRAHGTGVCVSWARGAAVAPSSNPADSPQAPPSVPTPPPATTDETGGTSI
jgi:hypothetical protein